MKFERYTFDQPRLCAIGVSGDVYLDVYILSPTKLITSQRSDFNIARQKHLSAVLSDYIIILIHFQYRRCCANGFSIKENV